MSRNRKKIDVMISNRYCHHRCNNNIIIPKDVDPRILDRVVIASACICDYHFSNFDPFSEKSTASYFLAITFINTSNSNKFSSNIVAVAAVA